MIKESDLIEKVSKRRQHVAISRTAPFWAAVNLFVALLLFTELYSGMIRYQFGIQLIVKILLTTEFVLAAVFSFNTAWNIYLYSWLHVFMQPIELNESEKILLGVKVNELGFKTFVPKPVIVSNKPIDKPKSPDMDSPRFSISPPAHLMYGRSPSQSSMMSTSPGLASGASSLNASLNSSSWIYQPGVGYAPNSSLIQQQQQNSLRKRMMSRNSSAADVIKDDRSLNEYMHSYEEMESKIEQLKEYEQKQTSANESWNASLSRDKNANQNSVTYQAADDSMVLGSDVELSQLEDQSGMSPMRRDGMTTLLKISEENLSTWVQNIRSYLSRTVFDRVVQEVNAVNQKLSKMGFTDSLIGEVGLSAIKQLATLKGKDIPSLPLLIPYLEISINQEYLVKRLRDLARGGCLTEFIWNGGAAYKNRPWSEELPTDSAIVMNAFCCYMDSRMPSAPNCPEGKAFSCQYFKPAVGQQSSGKLSPLYISEVKANPPCYKVVYKDEDVCDIPCGRNNIFYALLIFLHYVKIKNHSMLGRTNLGSSGVNVLWVLD